jgi:sugar/nucleoside kinase (ribokinase family)
LRPLAVIGNLARDVVEGRPPRVGGGPYYAAQGLRLLGRPARIATKLADADRPLLHGLAAAGIPVTWQRAETTAAFSFSYAGDERHMAVDEVGTPWTPEDLRGWAAPALDGVAWVHAAGLFRSDFPAETLRALARGRRVSLDGQALVRRPQIGPLVLDAEFDAAVLREVTVLKLAEEEARVLGALEEGGLAALGVPEVVVTLGARGSLVWCAGRLREVPALAVLGAVDPTGAGDAFAIGYVAARSSGYEPAAAAYRASVLVSALLAERV